MVSRHSANVNSCQTLLLVTLQARLQLAEHRQTNVSSDKATQIAEKVECKLTQHEDLQPGNTQTESNTQHRWPGQLLTTIIFQMQNKKGTAFLFFHHNAFWKQESYLAKIETKIKTKIRFRTILCPTHASYVIMRMYSSYIHLLLVRLNSLPVIRYLRMIHLHLPTLAAI